MLNRVKTVFLTLESHVMINLYREIKLKI